MQGGGEQDGRADGGREQGSLWQQSDLLDLMAAASPRSTVSPPDPASHQRPEHAESNRSDTSTSGATKAGATVRAAQPSEAVEPAEADPRQVISAPATTAISASASAEPECGATAEISGELVSGELAIGSAQPHGLADASVSPDISALGEATSMRSTDGRAKSGAARPAIAAAAARMVFPDSDPQTTGSALTAAGASLPACPQRLLILDTETTALSPQQGECIEVGAVLFDVTSRSVLMQVSFLLPCEHNPAQTVNGIPAAVSRLEQPWRSGLACFEAMVAGADALLAHNASFDRQWFGHGELPELHRPWICSMEDIRWPAERQLRATPSVRDLALAYGVPVWEAHRALTDCIYLVQVFQRCEQLEPLLQAALEPRRLVRARLSYDQRQLAKDAGFRWNEPVPKAWSRRLSEREIAALPFAVDPVETEETGVPAASGSQPLWRRSA